MEKNSWTPQRLFRELGSGRRGEKITKEDLEEKADERLGGWEVLGSGPFWDELWFFGVVVEVVGVAWSGVRVVLAL